MFLLDVIGRWFSTWSELRALSARLIYSDIDPDVDFGLAYEDTPTCTPNTSLNSPNMHFFCLPC